MIVHFSDLTAHDKRIPVAAGACHAEVPETGTSDARSAPTLACHGAVRLDGHVPNLVHVAGVGARPQSRAGWARPDHSIQIVRDLLAAQEVDAALQHCASIADDFIRHTMRGIIFSVRGERRLERELFQALLGGELHPVQRSVTFANLADTALLEGDLVEAERLARCAMGEHMGDQRPVPWLNLFTAIARQRQPVRRMELRFETEVRRLQYFWPEGARSPFLQYAITHDPELDPLRDYLVERKRRSECGPSPHDAPTGVFALSV